eukprot:CAMPEP_0197393080 /NCGR_PEP_ID=MMETSP1165-20131217/4113_1 /TAXON_ID=284809 /ORGANISM="Chrysocystis fragilis, Strain CCMP3189" /LENGTH=241 /DNA_ID=CAMNT_0042918737 /DNA_START=415 /DNA_END=1136 /DNA_ORIENTATION=-
MAVKAEQQPLGLEPWPLEYREEGVPELRRVLGAGQYPSELEPFSAAEGGGGVEERLQQLQIGAQPARYVERERQFKTRLCVYLGSGACPHGARCLFAHSVDELRAAPSHRSSAEYKTKLCRYSLAECPFAAVGRCQFAHSVEELRAPGNHGASSRRFKTRLCKYHMAGHCPYAATNTCQFAHSEDELRSPAPAWRSPSEWYSVNAPAACQLPGAEPDPAKRSNRVVVVPPTAPTPRSAPTA